MTRYLITTANGTTHTGGVQGSGGKLGGQGGLKCLRLASKGRSVDVFDPTGVPMFSTGPEGITHVAVYDNDETRDYTIVPILGATIELA